MNTMFGVSLCNCDDPYEENCVDGLIFCETCHGLVRLPTTDPKERSLMKARVEVRTKAWVKAYVTVDVAPDVTALNTGEQYAIDNAGDLDWKYDGLCEDEEITAIGAS